MANYFYNGLKLPKLPELKYPHAVIRHLDAFTSSWGNPDEPERYQLTVANAPYYAEDTSIHLPVDTPYQVWYCRAPDFTKWELDIDGNVAILTYTDILWTNSDIYYGTYVSGVGVEYTDELFMAKSPDPVLITPAFDLPSWLIGYALGLAGKAMPIDSNGGDLNG